MWGGVPSPSLHNPHLPPVARVLTPRGLGLLPISSPSGSSFLLSLPSAALLDSPHLAGRSCWVLGLAVAMDDCREVRLARKKGKKRPPSAAPPAEREREVEAEGGGASRGRDRFHALWRDYHDLLKETEAKKRRLESINQRKLGLIAEVKFLRKKYNLFAKDDLQQSQHRLKKRARQIPSPVGRNEALAFRGATGEVPSTSKNTNLDLNQDSVMNGEGADCQGYQDHPKLGKLDQAGVDEDMMTTDVNLSVCRDTGNSPASDDKRAAAWQDRVALKV